MDSFFLKLIFTFESEFFLRSSEMLGERGLPSAS